jgi:hypothetical protein
LKNKNTIKKIKQINLNYVAFISSSERISSKIPLLKLSLEKRKRNPLREEDLPKY